MKLARSVTLCLLALLAMTAHGQVNTDQVMRIGQNALYFEDYMLSIQYFNLAIASKPRLAQPYFYRSIAKINLDDYQGAEDDASLAIKYNPYIVDAYEVRGVARQNQGKLQGAVDDYTHALELLPLNRHIMFNKALAQQELGDTVGATATFAELLQAHPGYDNGYVGRARLLLAQGDTVGASADIDRAISINRANTNAYVMRAEIAINRGEGDFARALEDMDEAIKLQPRQAGLFVNRAFLRYKLDDYFGAMADYDYAIQLDPLNVAALFNRGVLRAEVRDNDRAIVDFTDVLRLQPDDPRALYNRALLYRDTHQWRKALADINRVIELAPDLPGAVFVRFDINREMGNMAAARRDYDHAQKLARVMKPTEAPAMASDTAMVEQTAARFSTLITLDNSDTPLEQEYHNSAIRGKVQDRNVNVEIEPLFALTYYAASTELKPSAYFLREADDVNATHILPNLLMVSNDWMTIEDPVEIERHFKTIGDVTAVIESGQPRPIDHFARAMSEMTVRNYQAAIADLDANIALTPDFALAWLQRGVARVKASEQPVSDENQDGELTAARRRQAAFDALADFDKAAELSPQMAFAYYNKGVVYTQLQDFTSALAAFTRAIEALPTMGEAYYNRGYVYLKLGNREAGTRDLSKAGELGIVPSYNLLKRMRP